ncbi:MAG TPA: hypothetical protein VKV73_21640 [Chloroflexota bacterium]|nr:hypothetical protein [Chloroflexota bacterium]
MSTQIPDGDGSRQATTAAPGLLSVELTPARAEMEPGASPVEVVLTLHNLSNVVEQYTVEVSGLEADWFTAPVISLSLFPQDRDQVRISLHAPKGPGLRAGAYPFQVTARARSGSADQSAHGVLEVRGIAIYRIVDLAPRRLTSRGPGTFHLQVANTGAADVRLGLEGRDTDDECTFSFPKQESLVAAGARVELPVQVKPRKRPWVGPERSYDFTITAHPTDARGDSQMASAQLTYRPPFRAFPIWPILKWLLIALALIVVVVGLYALGIPQEFGRRAEVAQAQSCGSLRNVPVLGGVCPTRSSTLPQANAPCAYEFGFKEFADAEPAMVAACTLPSSLAEAISGFPALIYGNGWAPCAQRNCVPSPVLPDAVVSGGRRRTCRTVVDRF